jgi:hypothetical protein
MPFPYNSAKLIDVEIKTKIWRRLKHVESVSFARVKIERIAILYLSQRGAAALNEAILPN